MLKEDRFDFRSKYGPWALVAGASAGLGAEFATQLAARGLNVILVARQADRLTQLSATLATEQHVQVRTLPIDLADDDAPEAIVTQTNDIEIGLLVYNAAYSAIGAFLDRPLEHHRRELNTNCRAPLTLAYRLGQKMRARQRGGIVLMSSLSALHGSPMIANYAATKAFNQVLAEGLWDELRRSSVAVLACCAGATATPGYLASRPKAAHFNAGSAMTPQVVVAEALQALGTQPSLIPGRGNRLAAFIMRRVLPRRIAIQIMGHTLRQMYT
jgi:short-subunit dehydrogenase